MTLPGPGTFVVLLVLWTGSAVLVFSHAQRHGSAHPTAWGVAAFLASGVVLPVYFVRYWMRSRR